MTGSRSGSKSKSCPKGYIKRASYTKKSGVHVPANCITATSFTGQKRSSINKKITSRKTSLQKRSSKDYGTPKCGKGQIMREGYVKKPYTRHGYTRKNGTPVKSTRVGSVEVGPTCVEARGLAKQTGKREHP